jgi:hypothetical protein
MRAAENPQVHSSGSANHSTLSQGMARSALPVWCWPVVILISAFAVNYVVITGFQSMVRPLLVMWFLMVCPGIAFVRLLRFDSFVIELTLAVALSLALDTIVAVSLIYLGVSSTVVWLIALGCLCAAGAFAQLFLVYLDHNGGDERP